MKDIKKEIISDTEFDLICEYIKLRNNSNMSQRDLAKKIGVAQSTIARMEKNLHSISLGTFVKIMSALDSELKIVRKKGDNSEARQNAFNRQNI